MKKSTQYNTLIFKKLSIFSSLLKPAMNSALMNINNNVKLRLPHNVKHY